MRVTKANKTTQNGQTMTRLAKRAVLLGLLVATGSAAQAQQSSGVQINPRFYDNTAPQVVPQSARTLNRPIVSAGTVQKNPFFQSTRSTRTSTAQSGTLPGHAAGPRYVPKVRRRPLSSITSPVPLAYTPGAAAPIQAPLSTKPAATVSQIAVSATDRSQVIPVADAQESVGEQAKQPVIFALSDDSFDAPDPLESTTQSQEGPKLQEPTSEQVKPESNAPPIAANESPLPQPKTSPETQPHSHQADVSGASAVEAKGTKPATIDTVETAVKLAPVVEFSFPDPLETTTDSIPESSQPSVQQIDLTKASAAASSDSTATGDDHELVVRSQQRLVQKKTPAISTLTDQRSDVSELQSWDPSNGTVIAAPAPVLNELPSPNKDSGFYQLADDSELSRSESDPDSPASDEQSIAIEPWIGSSEVSSANRVSVDSTSAFDQRVNLGNGEIAVSLPPIQIERLGDTSGSAGAPFGAAQHDPTEFRLGDMQTGGEESNLSQPLDSPTASDQEFADIAMPQALSNENQSDRGTIHIAKALPMPVIPMESDRPVVSKIAIDPNAGAEMPTSVAAPMAGAPVAVERVEVDITNEDQESYTPPARLAVGEGTHGMESVEGDRASDEPSSNNVLLELSKAQVRSMTIGGKLRRISVGDTQVCQAFASTENQLKLIGTGIGRTQLTVWADVVSGEPTRKQTFDIEVLGSVDARGAKIASRTKLLNDSIDNAFPRASVVVALHDGELVVTGRCDDENTAKQIIRMVRKSCLVPVKDNLQVR